MVETSVPSTENMRIVPTLRKKLRRSVYPAWKITAAAAQVEHLGPAEEVRVDVRYTAHDRADRDADERRDARLGQDAVLLDPHAAQDDDAHDCGLRARTPPTREAGALPPSQHQPTHTTPPPRPPPPCRARRPPRRSRRRRAGALTRARQSASNQCASSCC